MSSARQSILDHYGAPRESDGPAQAKVRATLANRPAGELYRINFDGEDEYCNAEYTFAALFNGARQGSGVPGYGMSFGKAEAEWGWPSAWIALRDAGLITFDVIVVASPATVGGVVERVTWSITEKGMQVRQDDLAWCRELMAAKDEDDPR